MWEDKKVCDVSQNSCGTRKSTSCLSALFAEGLTCVSKRTLLATNTEHDPAPLCRLSLHLDTDSWVYQAAQYEGVLPPISVAVEDSASGVGSAFAAEMGLIVGYVGASHISEVSSLPPAG